MATIRVCDRCMTTPVTDETSYSFTLVMLSPKRASDNYEVGSDDEALELCEDCAKVVRNLAQKMKLGPDAVKGGVRKMVRKPKAEAETETE